MQTTSQYYTLCLATLLNKHGNNMNILFKKSIRQFLCPENVQLHEFKRVFDYLC